jgi:hypothetical protein
MNWKEIDKLIQDDSVKCDAWLRGYVNMFLKASEVSWTKGATNGAATNGEQAEAHGSARTERTGTAEEGTGTGQC